MRVFYDTNVLLSILLWPGEVSRVHAALVKRGFIPVTSERVVGEAVGIARRKLSGSEATEVERAIRDEWEVIASTSAQASVSLRDPDDEHILADAEASGADVLLSGDRDLLDAAEAVTTLSVLSVREFSERYGDV